MPLYSQSCAYAILALTRIADSPESPLSAKEIADYYDVSNASISQALFQLKRGKIVTGKRGKGGGFVLAVPASSLSLMDIIKAMGCEHDLPCCLFGLNDQIALAHCTTISFWKEERKRIVTMLSNTRLEDLRKKQNSESTEINPKAPLARCDGPHFQPSGGCHSS